MNSNENLKVLSFEAANIPIPSESSEKDDAKYVSYGVGNVYPNYLLYLYNNSPIHSSIINAKTTYIIGDGLKYKDGKDLDLKVNPSDNIKEFVDKVIKDYLIFNYFFVEVIYNVFGEPVEFHHVPAQQVRVNKSKTKFWFNEDFKTSRKTIIYDRWSLKSSDTTSKIFFFDGYYPSVNSTYSPPDYNGSIKSIATDIKIRDFNLNNISNHFSVSTIITFFNGSNVADDVKRQVVEDLKASYSGENGKKMIVDFQNPNGQAADVKNLAPNDWSEAYEVLRKDVSDDIYRGHQVTSPMLMGVKTEGQLGGASELETAYQIFKQNYIRVKRDELESALNLLFTNFKEVNGKVAFADKPLFSTQLSETLKEKVMTINELRAEAGLASIAGGDRLLSEPVSAPVQSPVPVEQSEEAEEVKKKTYHKLTEEDFEKIKGFGISSDEYEILERFTENQKFQFDKQTDIADYVLDNDIKHLSVEQLAELLKKNAGVEVSTNDLKSMLKNLHESGVIKVSYDDEGKLQIKPNKTPDVPDTDKIMVMYKYEKRPDVSGGDLLPTSRSFCKKLINNNRLYTLQEIQTMSSIFKYSVKDFAGGWYYNPDTGESTPYCRHQFVSYSVKRKSK